MIFSSALQSAQQERRPTQWVASVVLILWLGFQGLSGVGVENQKRRACRHAAFGFAWQQYLANLDAS